MFCITDVDDSPGERDLLYRRSKCFRKPYGFDDYVRAPPGGQLLQFLAAEIGRGFALNRCNTV